MVTILTGDSDNLIRPSNSRVLKQHMPEAELRVWEDTGHAMHIQWPTRYCNLLNETLRRVSGGTIKHLLYNRNFRSILYNSVIHQFISLS
jgi:hypothetical protein